MTSSVRKLKTRAFWMKYINPMPIYNNFTRSFRTGDFELYIACLPKITNLFLAFNHVNYARWLVKYYDAIIKLPYKHVEVYKDFKNIWFGVKRTTNSFSSTPMT